MFRSRIKDAAQAVQERVYPEVVEKIHNEFDSAADELVRQAQELIGNTVVPNDEKVSRLARLGFASVKEVATAKQNKQNVQLSQKQIDLVNYYSEHYPNNKFITFAQVETICKKYNLVFGDVSRFTGFVPEVKLSEMEEFKLREEEKDCLIFDVSGELIAIKGAEIRSRRGYCHIHKKEGSDYEYAFQSNDGVNFYASDSKDLFGLAHLGSVNATMLRLINKSLKICAPIRDMNTDGMTIKDGFKLSKHVPDPVVLQAVEGGFLVVTKWGDEASDEILN